MLLKMFATVAALVCGIAAQAQTTHLPGEVPFALGADPTVLVGLHLVDAAGPFVDVFAFTVGGSGTVSAAFLLPGLLNSLIPAEAVPFLAVPTYFGLINSQGAELGADNDFSDGQMILANLSVTAGTYAFVVAGLTPAPLGLYAAVATAQITAVPEPDTYAMLLAGVGMVGWLARRRKA